MTLTTLQQMLEIGLQHHQAGRLLDAEAAYREILRHAPTCIPALHYLGVASMQQGENNTAVDLIERTVKLDGGRDPVSLSNLAEAYRRSGRLDRAIAAGQAAVKVNPNYAPALGNLGLSLSAAGRTAEAEVAFRRALQNDPNLAEAATNLGALLAGQGRYTDAIALYRHAIQSNPGYAIAYNNLGTVLERTEDLAGAEAAYRQAIQIDTSMAETLNNLGTVLQSQGRLAEAIEWWERTIEIQPNHLGAQSNRAFATLTLGNYARGWELHEGRRRSPTHVAPRSLAGKRPWDGSPLDGKNILIYTEQGYGDVIQFARFIPAVAERGGRVLLLVENSLASVMESVQGVAKMFVTDDITEPFDVYLPLLSLPHVLGVTIENLPARVPYIAADEARTEAWRLRLAADEIEGALPMRVGVAWAGRPTHRNDRNRSMPASALLPLADVKGVQLYSLQKGDAAEQAKAAGLRLIDRTADLHVFADTAALIQNLDVVLAVDTAVAHVAGALGKPTWVMIPFAPDWRWLLDREDSPWYPTVRLFRQASRGDWAGVVDRVRENLAVAATSHVRP